MKLLSRVRLFATPWTVAYQAFLSMGFSRQEYWSGLPFPSPGDLPNPGIKPTSLASPALAGGFFTAELSGKPYIYTCIYTQIKICSFSDDYKSILLKKFLKNGSSGTFFGINMGQMNIIWLMTGRQ